MQNDPENPLPPEETRPDDLDGRAEIASVAPLLRNDNPLGSEPSVLDVVRARLALLRDPRQWRRTLSEPLLPLDPPQLTDNPSPATDDGIPAMDAPPATAAGYGLLAAGYKFLLPLLALAIALMAQVRLEPGPDPQRWQLSLLLYLLAFGLLLFATWQKLFQPVEVTPPSPGGKGAGGEGDPLTARLLPLLASGILAPLAFLAFGGNRFTSFNLGFGLLCLALALYALYLPSPRQAGTNHSPAAGPTPPATGYQLPATVYRLLPILAVILIALFYRLYLLDQVPPEMNSDHAEKLQDVADVLNGQYSIFFPRNTGREALQFYWIALTAELFGTGVSFISMKIQAALAGLLALPYIYLLAKELSADKQRGHWVGLLAVLLVAVAAWPNILSRVALRFSLYPLFVAPLLYHLIRGLQRGNRNDFLWAGLFLGLGLHGYTPMRIAPLVVLVAVALYWLHTPDRRLRQQSLLFLGMLVLVSFLIFLPLLRYAYEQPESFAYRAFTRLLDWEQPIPNQLGGLLAVFFSNLKNALLMFGWNAGNIWPVSVTGRPALDALSAALFYLGFGFLLLRYLRRRRWQDLFLALAVPLLMLPSILSLAFPGENPAPNRAGAAMIPVFIIAAVMLEACWYSLRQAFAAVPAAPAGAAGATNRETIPALLLLALLCIPLYGNYSLTFVHYARTYELSSWNTSEMGAVIRNFAGSIGSYQNAWVVASPHWVDTRLVGMQAGDIGRDYAIWPDQIAATAIDGDARPKLFIARPDDQAALQALQQTYPQGYLSTYTSSYQNKDFWLYLVLPAGNPIPADPGAPALAPISPYPLPTITP